jgi:serine/threonine-protein kinase
MLGGRYRIVGLLGRGGMGEVYRAEDLTLGQAVALKLLPEEAAGDEAKMSRFLAEVRIARQVSHPNVCRVYDIGEVEGLRFISMEYVDGEDLATLLRRIGRFAQDKAVQIARQICAGLAAAHDRGVIHRDLKPANVMIDGRGKVRITDFGLAGLAGDVRDAGIRAGTPAYMAPEQFAGKEVTVRSDVYALGLVLYELFTGRMAFDPGSRKAPASPRESPTVTSPSSHVPDLDPAVERIILRSLAEDPGQRPASALAVAAALPGGDPLAEALAAGETPSPGMVAAAGEEGVLRPAIAWALLASAVAGLVVAVLLGSRLVLTHFVPLERPPEVLADRGREILSRLGYAGPGVDSASGFMAERDYLRYVTEIDGSMGRWERLRAARPHAVSFWYRESPRPMVSSQAFGNVTPDDPSLLLPGMVALALDPVGRLLRFDAVPPQKDEAEGPWEDPDWSVAFEEAGLDRSLLEPAQSIWTPPVASDARFAWTGFFPGQAEPEIRVEVASWRGRPVFFRVIMPWTEAVSPEPPQRIMAEWVEDIALPAILVGMIAFGIFLARRNLRLGRGDLGGALKLALGMLVVHMLVWTLWADHVAAFAGEFQIFARTTGYTLFGASLVWLYYIALEPFVRRRWPDALISWSRLLGGSYRDPLVGRDVLIGVLVGVVLFLSRSASSIIPTWAGLAPETPRMPNLICLDGLAPTIGQVLDAPLHGVVMCMQGLFLLVLLRVLLRSQWLAGAVLVLGFGVLLGSGREYPAFAIAFVVFSLAVWFLVVVRVGLLAAAAGAAIAELLRVVPLTTALASWHGIGTVAAVLFCVGLALYGFITAQPGRPLFSGRLLEE